jgi:MazG family protein
VGRINFANGDMVGHTGDFAATLLSVAAVDLALGRLMECARETNTILVVTADHGNADEMFEVEKKSGKVQFDAAGNPRVKTSHTLSPVPFIIFNAEILSCSIELRGGLPAAGLANVAATVLELAGFESPAGYESSLIQMTVSHGNGVEKTSKGTSTSATFSALQHPKLVSATAVPEQRNHFALGLRSVLFAKTISALRAPDGCPWDKEQSIDSLRPYLVEEAYEAIEAAGRYAQNGDLASAQAYCAELGDVLLQVFLNAQIASEKKHFSVSDVFSDIIEKMVRRHPHVFADDGKLLATAGEVVQQWDAIKANENASAGKEKRPSLLAKARKKSAQPTLAYTSAVSKSSYRLGFAWKTLEQTFADVTSEVDELRRELWQENPDRTRIADELGDVVLALANVVVFMNESKFSEGQPIDFDLAARGSVEKFLSRFEGMETILRERGNEVSEDFAKALSLEVWDELWRESKRRKYS